MKKFSIGEALSYGWEATKAHLPFFVVVILITFAVNFAPQFLLKGLREDVPMMSGLIGLVIWILSMLVSLGTLKISLKIVDKKKPEIADLFNAYPLLLIFIVSSIVYALIVGIGFLLLIIPGVILGIKYHFYSYLIIDKKMGPIEALKKSGEITKGVKWDLFVFGLACGFINLLGLLALGIGLFITIPLTMLAYAHVYRKLLGSG